MNEQHSHITPTYYTGIQQSGVDNSPSYSQKLSHWNIGSYGPSSYPPDVHEHYLLKGNVKEEKQAVYALELHHGNERQWCPTTWVSDIPNATNISKLEGRNNRQLPLVHSSYVSNTKINDSSYNVSSYSAYNQIDNTGDMALVPVSPDNTHGQIHTVYSENLQYSTNSKFLTKNRKILKTKYYYGETDGNWSCQNLDNPNEQMYEHYGSEIHKNVTIGAQFTNDVQNYNKQIEASEQQRNCRSASSVEDIHHNQCDNWNVSNTGASDKIIPVVKNSASMPLLEKVDRKLNSERMPEPPRVNKSSIYTELKTYTPREREMPVLECMLEPYGSQCSLNAQPIGEHSSETSMEISPTTEAVNKNDNDGDNVGNLHLSNELPKIEKKTNPRTQAIRNMKRMRTSFYMKLDEQIGIEKPINCIESNETTPIKTVRPKKPHRSRRKYKARAKRFTFRRKRKLHPALQFVRFHGVYIASDIDIPMLRNIGKEQLILKRLPNSVFEQYKLFNGADIEKSDALPESLPALKMTLRITRHGNTNYNSLEKISGYDDDVNSQNISSVEIAEKDCVVVPKKVVKHESFTTETEYKDNEAMCSNTVLPNVRLPLKLKIKLPNRHLLNYKNDVPEQLPLKQPHLQVTKEKKYLRRKAVLRNKNIIKQASATTRTKRSTVDYGQDAYYHLLNYEELWDVFDEDMCESKESALNESLVNNGETAQQKENTNELLVDSKKDCGTTNELLDDSKKDCSAANDLWETPPIVKDEIGQYCLDSNGLPLAKIESLCSKVEHYLPCEVEPSSEIDDANEKACNVQSTARKSILLSVKGDEIYDFIFDENAKEQSAKATSAKFWENDSTNDATASSQIVCDNISEENQKVDPQDMFIMTKMSHSGFFLNSDCNKSSNSMPQNNIAHSASAILPAETEYSVESNYQHSLIPCPERQIQPEILQKDYRDYESSFMARDEYQYALHDIQKSRNHSVIETGYCNPSAFTGDTKHLEVSIYHKITPLNEEKT